MLVPGGVGSTCELASPARAARSNSTGQSSHYEQTSMQFMRILNEVRSFDHLNADA